MLVLIFVKRLTEMQLENEPKTWNHYESDIRTNNYLEGFNSALNRLIRTSHPSIFVLIKFFKQQQANAIVDYARLKQCQQIRKKPRKEKEKQFTLELIKIQHKDCQNLADYLSNLWHYVEFPYEYWHDDYTAELKSVFFDEGDSLEVEESIDILPELNLNVSPQTTTSSETISVIHESNALIHDTNAVQPSTSRLLRIADVLPLINFDEEEDDHFDYIGQTLHRDALNRMFAERQAERVEKENAISARVNAITNEEIEAEVKKMWSVGGDFNKRKRISKNEREKVKLNSKQS